VTPAFSIVIPTFDRPAGLAACLAAVARLDYPRERFETIVVDDGGSRRVEPAPGAADGLSVRLERQPNAGPGAARNRGVAAASGRWVAFTDDDCEPEPSWLTALESRFADGADAVVGLTTNALPDNPYASAGQLLSEFLHGYYNQDAADARFGASNNLAVDRGVFLAAGGFDETFGHTASEDRELIHRLRACGHRLVYAPDANVRHRHRQDLRGFWRQHYGYGRGAVAFRERAGSVPIEPLSFYGGLVRSGPGRLAALLALTQVANTAGFARESLRRRLR
jgi:GT2 family glycosyltransferase